MEVNKNSVLMHIMHEVTSDNMYLVHDDLLILSNDEYKMVFAVSSKYKQYVVNSLNFHFNIWLGKRTLLMKLLQDNIHAIHFYGNLMQIVIDYCVGDIAVAPTKCCFNIDHLNKDIFKDVILSDQFVGGIIACRMCIKQHPHEYKCLLNYNDKWWFDHVSSRTHKRNEEKNA